MSQIIKLIFFLVYFNSMIKIPFDILSCFSSLLIKNAIEQRYHYHYKKWLRYYFDFCHKYKYPKESYNSLPYFINKLQEKNQNQFQQKQAAHAISLYYEITQ